LHLTTSFYFRIYRDILKHEKKADHYILCPPFFLAKIGEEKARTTNPQNFTTVRRFALYDKIMNFVH